MAQKYWQKPITRKFHVIQCCSCQKQARVPVYRKALCDACFTGRQTDYRTSFNEEEMKRLNTYLKKHELQSKLY